MVVGGLLSGAAGGATVAITIKTIDKFSVGFKKASKGLGALGAAASAGVAAVAAAGIGLAALGTSAVKSALQLQPIEKGFNRLTEDSDRFLRTLNEVTKGTVSNFELMSSANTALLLGIDQEALPSLFKNAAIVGRAAGRTTTEALNDITVGIGRQSRLILDNLGIIVNAEQAYDNYAVSIGKVTSELTDNEKKAAFTAATIESLNAKAADLGGTLDEDATTAVSQLSAQFDNLRAELGKEVLPVFTDLAQTLVKEVLPSVRPLIPVIGDFLKDALITVKDVVVPLIPDMIALVRTFFELAQTIRRILGPVLRAILPILRVVANLVRIIGNAIGGVLEFLDIGGKLSTIGRGISGLFGRGRNRGVRRVNDFIIRPSGQVLETNPQDTIVGMKNPGGMGNTFVFNIERIQGTDPDDMLEAFQRELNKKIRLG